jgi:CBS domain containing-hemolysin-like protein
MSIYTSLHTKKLSENPIPTLCSESGLNLTLKSAAYDAMYNFDLALPYIIDGSTSLNDALLILKKTHVRTCFVVNEHHVFQGVISKARLSSSYVLKVAAKLGLKRADLMVSHVMVPLMQLHSVSSNIVESACVGDILQTMQSAGHEFLFVIDKSHHMPCGYFDLIRLAKQVECPVRQVKLAGTFTEIIDSLWHHSEI